MSNTNNQNQRPWYKNYMITVFVIGLPAFVVVACIVFIFYALSIQDSTVRDDWYMDGKALYQDASKDQLAHTIGAAGILRFDGDAVRFELNFPADSVARGTLANGSPLHYPTTLKVSISHATDKQKDRDLILTHDTDNRYTGTLTLDSTPAKYYISISTPDDTEAASAWRLIHAQKLPTQTVSLVPLDAFKEQQAYSATN